MTVDQLRECVIVMRELGVVSWDGVVLGPEPPKREYRAPRSLDEQARVRAQWTRYRRLAQDAEIDGTPLPTPPLDTEEDPNASA